MKLKPPRRDTVSEQTRRSAEHDYESGRHGGGPTSRARSRATREALGHAGRDVVSKAALAKQAKSAARRRGAGSRSAAAKKAVRTKGPGRRSVAARKAAKTRARPRKSS